VTTFKLLYYDDTTSAWIEYINVGGLNVSRTGRKVNHAKYNRVLRGIK